MNQNDIAGLTVYSDLATILQDRGYTDAEAAEMIMKLTAQAEMEVVEEIMGKLTDDQLKILDSLPTDAPVGEIAQKLGFNGEEIDLLRATKTAQLIAEAIPALNEESANIQTQQ